MKGKKTAIVVLLLAGLALAFPLVTFSQSGIIVTGADSVLDTSSVYSSDIVSTTLSIGPRVAVEYAHSTEPRLLSEIPAPLQNYVGAVAARVAVEYAHSTEPRALSNIPTELQDRVNAALDRVAVEYACSIVPIALNAVPSGFQTLIDAVSKRVAVEYARSTGAQKLVYPLELLHDTVPPQISDIATNPVGSGSVNVTWTTDEFATSIVYYGTQPGVYPNTISDSYYTKRHTVNLSGLAPQTRYYFLVSGADQSDNTATSAEHSFSTAIQITKSVSPQCQVNYGDELTYTLVISGMLETQAGIYDPLEGTNFVRFVQQPGNVTHDNGVITGTLTVPPDEQVTVSFVVRVSVPGTAGLTVDVTNDACVYPVSGTIADECIWSNDVMNEAFRPYGIYLPIVLRAYTVP